MDDGAVLDLQARRRARRAVTLLLAFANKDAIVIACDTKTTDTAVFEDVSFKFRWIAPGSVAMYTTEDANSCDSILQQTALTHDDVAPKNRFRDPYVYARRLQKVAQRQLRNTYGRFWQKEAPDSTFVLVGWKFLTRAEPLPLAITLKSPLFEPVLSAECLPYAIFGGGVIARYLKSVLLPPFPLPTEVLIMLAAFLIAESSRKLDTVGYMPWIQVLRPKEINATPLTTHEYTTMVQPTVTDMQRLLRRAIEVPLQIPATRDATPPGPPKRSA